jgi:hypothetical protein
MLVIVVVICTADRFRLTSDESHGSLYLLTCSSSNSSSSSNNSCTATAQQQPGGVTVAADNVHWSTTATSAAATTAATGTTATAEQQQQQQRLSAHLFCKKCGVHVCHAPSFPASAVADVNVHCIHTDTVASLTVAFIRDEVVLPGRGLPVLQQLELDDQLIHSAATSQQQQQQQQQQSQADDADSNDNAATGGEQSKERSQEQSNWPLQQRASLAHLAALSDSSAYDTLKNSAATADATSATTTALNTANSSLHSNAGSANAHWGVAAAENTCISSSISSGSSSGGFRRASEPLSLTIPSQRVVNADASAEVTADASSSISGTTDWRRQQQQQQWQLEHDEAAGGVINDKTFASRFNQGEQQ